MNYILHGNDISRIKQKLANLKTSNHIENTVTFDALSDEQSSVLSEMDSFSIFDENKMIVVDNATFLSNKDTTHYELEPFIKRIDQNDFMMVFICPTEKLSSRNKMVKTIVSQSKVYPCIALDVKSLPSYLEESLKRHKLEMDFDARRWFLNHVGYDSLRIDQELYKLKTYKDHISLADVELMVAPEPLDDVFKMVDALFQKNALRLLAFYRNFRELNMEPVAINGLLSGQIRFLFQVRHLMDRGLGKDEIASIMKAHPYRIQINMQRAREFSSEDLLDMLELLADLDQNIKSGKIDKDEGFEQFILKMLE
ncbi:MAG: DNA polymerase III subunit delta [Faecalicoccus sp.]|nr:DNA polymerase III subunit delta [Faecalicoccus sp.]